MKKNTQQQSEHDTGQFRFTRRSLMKAGGATLLTTAAIPQPVWADDDDAENKPFLDGYAGTRSCVAGDKVTFHTSTNVDRYDVEIARIGLERKVVWAKKNLPGGEYELPLQATSHG